MQTLVALARATYEAWTADNAQRLAAALAFSITFVLAPFLIVVVDLASLTLGLVHMNGHLARDEIMAAVTSSAGPAPAQALGAIVDATLSNQGHSILAAIVGSIVLISSAAGLFGSVQDALNTVFNVAATRKRGIWATIRDRFASFAMVGGIALLLIVTLVANATVTAFTQVIEGIAPGLTPVLQISGLVLSFAITAVLVAIIYKWLPEVNLRWHDVRVGALITAVLFTIGEILLGLYLRQAGTTSVYGSAGSLVVVLFWVYYSAQILLLGAEFTKVYAQVDRHHAAMLESPHVG